jgi:hypothetical protein
VNDVFKFPLLETSAVNQNTTFYEAFNGITAVQTKTTPLAIINGNPDPLSRKYTFYATTGIWDYTGLADNWK